MKMEGSYEARLELHRYKLGEVVKISKTGSENK